MDKYEIPLFRSERFEVVHSHPERAIYIGAKDIIDDRPIIHRILLKVIPGAINIQNPWDNSERYPQVISIDTKKKGLLLTDEKYYGRVQQAGSPFDNWVGAPKFLSQYISDLANNEYGFEGIRASNLKRILENRLTTIYAGKIDSWRRIAKISSEKKIAAMDD